MNKENETSEKVILGNWSFNEIKIEDKDLYSEYITKTSYNANLWISNFAMLWARSQSKGRKVLWKIVDGMLVSFGYLRNGILYLVCLPFGEGDTDKVINVLYKCLKYCYKWNELDDANTVLKVVNEPQLEFLKKSKDFDKYFRAVSLVGLEKHFSIKKLLSLEGKDFETVRRKINKFHRLYPGAIVRQYKNEDYDQVLALGEYWSETSGQKYSQVFDNVYFPEIIKHHDELDHMVLVVELEGKLIGMVSGGELPTGQSWWCISKFKNDFDGLSELLIIELAKAINKKNPNIELMNAGQDLGPGGLRFFKERFRPPLDLRRYIIRLR